MHLTVENPESHSDRRGVGRSLAWAAAMVFGVLILYLPPGIGRSNNRFDALDYDVLHRVRIQYAIDSLSSGESIPSWFTREQLGTPFWSNIQNFPFVPTRLILLPFGAGHLYTPAVTLAGVLAAVFTYLFARSIGAMPFASAVSGWTFAASGFFASRLLAGHLHLLEAYPALPLLLWLVERCARQTRLGGRPLRWRQLLPLGIAAMCVALCGHPQLPMYALAIAGLYALFRLRGLARWSAAAVMVSGVGCAAFTLLPMSLLVGRSTRVLDGLGYSANDIALPVSRIPGAFFLPWIDGWPEAVGKMPARSFGGYDNEAYFWDTFNYLGYAPWIALVVLVIWHVKQRQPPAGGAAFVVLMGAVCFLLALPWFQSLARQLPGTFVRAPCRLTYPVTLALSLALAGAVHMVLMHTKKRQAVMIVTAALVLHAIDLTMTTRQFVQPASPAGALDGRDDAWLEGLVGDGRVAYDTWLATSSNRRHDDIGFYDSIQMARYYEMITEMANLPRTEYIESLGSDELPTHVLRICGVRIEVGFVPRKDARLIGRRSGVLVHQIENAAPRVAFVPTDACRFMSPAEILPAIRGDPAQLESVLLLPSDAKKLVEGAMNKGESPVASTQLSPPLAASLPALSSIESTRPDPDSFEVSVVAAGPGFVRIIETFDPGWSASLNGRPVTIVPANHGMMAIPIASAGRHQLRLDYHTPGRFAGVTVSLCSAAAMAGLIVMRTR